MAAPSLDAKTSTLANDTGGAWAHTTAAPVAAGRLIVVHVFQDGTSSSSAITITSATNCTNLAGTSNVYTALAATGFPVGSVATPTGYHYIFFARSTGTSASVITGGNSGTDDIYVRTYQFNGVAAGATVAAILENTTAGGTTSTAATSTTVTPTNVVSLARDRLALCFVAVADDAQAAELTAMTGETSGDWGYLAAAGSGTGTDGTLALLSSAMAPAMTVSGGSDTITSEAWGLVAFALRPVLPDVFNGAVVSPFTFDSVVSGDVPFFQTTEARISLATGELPRNYAEHAIKIRARVTSGAGFLRVALYQGTTDITGEFQQTLTTSLADYTLGIEDYQAATIIDYSTLEVRIHGHAQGAITFEVDQVWLELPSPAQTGEVVSPFTFGSTVTGKIGVRGEVDSPFTFGSVVSASGESTGEVVSPFTFGSTVTGKVGAKAQIDSPFTFGSVVAGKIDAKSRVDSPFTFGSIVSGSATVEAEVVSPFTFGSVVSGKVEAKSTVDSPFTFGSVVSGSGTGGAEVVSPFTFDAVVSGKVTAKSAVDSPFTFGSVVDGTVEAPPETTVARISLAAGVTPESSADHSIFIRARVTSGTGTIWAALYEGTTNVSGDLSSALTTSLADYTLAIAEEDAGTITSYSDLEVRIWGVSATAATFEVDQVSLRIPDAAATGQVDSPFTFGRVVTGKVEAKGQVVTPFTFGAVTDGFIRGTPRTAAAGLIFLWGDQEANPAIVLPFTFGRTVTGRVGAKGRVDSPFTFGAVTEATAAGGEVVSPFTFGRTVTGKVGAKSSVDSPFTFGITSAAKVDAKGQVVSPFTFGELVNGIHGVRGQVVCPFTFGEVVTGRLEAKGRIDFPITFGIVTTAAGLGGTVHSPFTFGRVVTGRVDAKAQVSSPFTFGEVVAGIVTVKGQLVTPFTFGELVAGRIEAKGRVDFPITFGIVSTAAGQGGTVISPFTFGRVVNGVTTRRGQVSSPFTFGEVVSGRLGARGAVSLPLTFSVTSSGLITAKGRIDLPFVFGEVTTGLVHAFGAASLPFVWVTTTSGFIGFVILPHSPTGVITTSNRRLVRTDGELLSNTRSGRTRVISR